MGYEQTTCQRPPLGRDRPVAPFRASQAQGRAPAYLGAGAPDRHHFRPEERYPVGDAAPGTGLQVRDDLLVPPVRLGQHQVVERTVAWLAKDRCLAIRYERRDDMHEACLVVAIEQLVGDPAGGRLVGQIERGGPEPLGAHDGDDAVRHDAADCRVGRELFEPDHSLCLS